MKTLTEQQTNIAIAEAVGWKNIRTVAPGVTWGHHPETGYDHFVPNFCADLNAIAQAEATLTDEQRELFVQSLCDHVFTRSIRGWWDMTANEVGKMLASTALQRATAFVRALNLEPKSK